MKCIKETNIYPLNKYRLWLTKIHLSIYCILEWKTLIDCKNEYIHEWWLILTSTTTILKAVEKWKSSLYRQNCLCSKDFSNILCAFIIFIILLNSKYIHSQIHNTVNFSSDTCAHLEKNCFDTDIWMCFMVN